MRAPRLLWIAIPFSLVFLATSLASAADFSEWLPVETVAPDYSYLDTPAVAMSANGNATAVWTTSGRGGELFASYDPGTGFWSPAVVINTVEPNTTLYFPSVVMDDSGRAACMWVSYWNDDLNGSYPGSAYVNRYLPGGGWQGPELIGFIGQGYTIPGTVSFGKNGELFAAYTNHTVDESVIRARHYRPGFGWGQDDVLATNSTTRFPDFPMVAADASGNGVVAWTVSDENGSAREAWAAVYDAYFGGWMGSEQVDQQWGYGFVDDVAMAGGTPVVLISGYDEAGLLAQFVSRSWNEFGGWDAPLVIDPDNIGPREAVVVGDPSGRLTAVYSKRIGGIISINGSSYVPGIGWHAWGLIETVDANATQLAIASDNDGGAVAAWYGHNATVDMVGASRFRPSFGWEEAPPLFDWYDEVASFPTVGASPGKAIVAWHGIRTFHDVRAARFERDTEAPMFLLTAPDKTLFNTSGVLVAGYCSEFPCVVNVAGSTVVLDGLGYFEVTLTLADGPYHIDLAFYDREGNVRFTGRDVLVDTVAPLILTSPSSIVTATGLVAVYGSSEPGAMVTVNGTAVPVAADGAFTGVFVPAPGTHDIAVAVTDLAGNTNSTTVRVTFNDPAAAMAALAQALADANDTLSAAVLNLDAAQARLDSLESDAQATEAALAEARANVSLAKAAAENAAFQVSLAQANMTAAQQSAAAANARADDATRAAGSAQLIAILGVVLGLAGVGLGVMSAMRGRGVDRHMGRTAAQQAEPAKGGDHDKGPPPPPRG